MKTQFEKDEVVFISDTHFGHANIINYCSRPFIFPDTTEMDRVMMNALKAADAAGKTIIHLGDFVFRPDNVLAETWRPQGEHIIIMGNHDKNGDDRYRSLYREFFHDIIGKASTWKTNILGIEVGGVSILLSHMPQDTWFPPYKWNFHGHTHNHFTQPKSDRHCNLSVELIDYKTVTFDEALQVQRSKGFVKEYFDTWTKEQA